MNSAGECGRTSAGGGNEFFTEAVVAFHHAVSARLLPKHTVQDEATLG
jgi:hypothetical protein